MQAINETDLHRISTMDSRHHQRYITLLGYVLVDVDPTSPLYMYLTSLQEGDITIITFQAAQPPRRYRIPDPHPGLFANVVEGKKAHIWT